MNMMELYPKLVQLIKKLPKFSFVTLKVDNQLPEALERQRVPEENKCNLVSNLHDLSFLDENE
jgi:hypothetical protein